MPTPHDYTLAIVSVILWVLLVQALTIVSGRLKAGTTLAPGEEARADYADPVYRASRAYRNAVEALTVFAAAITMAILADAPPFWVNLLASLAVLSRLATAYVHISGLGKPSEGLRSITFLVGWVLIGVIAVLAFVGAVT